MTGHWLLVLPLLIPLLAAALSLLAWRRPMLQSAIGAMSAAALLAATIAIIVAVDRDGVQVTRIGDWPAPFGIVLVADRFSALMLLLAGGIGLAVSIYSLGSIDERRAAYGYYPLVQVLLMGVCGAFLTGDLFNLYVWFEVLLISSFVLLSLGGEREQLEGAIKYVTLNLIASALFLAAVGILYGLAGTLNFADLHGKLQNSGSEGLVTTIAMLFLMAFGIKAALFPLFFWLPASYHTPPVAVSALFAGLLTKVGVYAIMRTFTLLFVGDSHYTHTIIVVISALTMISGVLGAASQMEFRRILSIHIISQIGYMTLGLGLAGLTKVEWLQQLALGGAIFYMGHNIIVKTNLFLISGVAYRLEGTGELKRMGGLYLSHAWLAVLFLVSSLSLAGIPPLPGFFAKLSLIRAALSAEQHLAAAAAIGVGLLTLYSMNKIWNEAFWKPRPEEELEAERVREESLPEDDLGFAALVAPIVVLVAVTIAISIFAEPVLAYCLQAAADLLKPTAYVQAVLGDSP